MDPGNGWPHLFFPFFSSFRVFVILLIHSDGIVDNAIPSITNFS